MVKNPPSNAGDAEPILVVEQATWWISLHAATRKTTCRNYWVQALIVYAQQEESPCKAMKSLHAPQQQKPYATKNNNNNSKKQTG